MEFEDFDYNQESKKSYFLMSRIALILFFGKIRDLKKRRILDFECGFGQNTYLLRQNNVKVFSSSEEEKAFLKEKGFEQYSSERSVPNFSAEILLYSNQLQKTENPLEKLKLLKSKLKSKGILLLGIPLSKEEKKIVSSSENKENSKELSEEKEQLFSWDAITINNLLEKAGFRVLRVQEIYGAGFKGLSFLEKFNFGLYLWATRFFGKILKQKDLFIIATKDENFRTD
jgi:SAM-dependent methyltransferase